MQTETRLEEKRVFNVAVRHMPMGHIFNVPILARTLEEAQRRAVEWDAAHYRAPGAYEYYELA
jgi:hypothetical protein